jgi:hypothetical protein
MLEGTNAFHRIRLSEAGIDNAQNLAEANIIAAKNSVSAEDPQTGVSKLKIDLIYQQTKDDNEVARLVEFQNRLSSLGDKQDA